MISVQTGGWILLLLLLVQTSCKKLVEVGAPDSATVVGDVFSTDASAAAVLTGIYTNMSYSNSIQFGTNGFTSMSLFPGLSADELKLHALSNIRYAAYYNNDLISSTSAVAKTADFWKTIYPIVFTTNSAIEGLGATTSLSPAVKKQLMGEAKFMRAFCYFYLVNLYGEVPLALSTDWKVNAILTRAPVAKVYGQIIADLKDAQSLLSSDYLLGDVIRRSAERVRPSKWAASALLARTYLYTGDWVNAEVQASLVISHTTLFSLPALSSAFLRRSREAIWQLKPVGLSPGTDANTGEGKFFILPSSGPNSGSYPVYLSDYVVNSFETNDQRKTIWADSVASGSKVYFYPYKYKMPLTDTEEPVTEFSVVLRLGEQFLIRAEARAQQNNIPGAQSDLNAIRTRAGLPYTTAGDKPTLLTDIMQERKVELFTEWGHRWFDLKRTGTVNEVMGMITSTKGGIWQTTDQLYPIPASEIKLAPQLVQNPGY